MGSGCMSVATGRAVCVDVESTYGVGNPPNGVGDGIGQSTVDSTSERAPPAGEPAGGAITQPRRDTTQLATTSASAWPRCDDGCRRFAEAAGEVSHSHLSC